MDVEEEEEEEVEEEDRFQDQEAHFARASAVEMHTGIAQEACARKFTGKMPNTNPGASILCEPAQSKCAWTCHKRNFVRKFAGKITHASPTDIVLREPAQWKCTWTCHKRHFVGKFRGKMPDAGR